LNRLIYISMRVIVPFAELDRNPLPNAIALMTIEEAKSNPLPFGAARMALQVTGLRAMRTSISGSSCSRL